MHIQKKRYRFRQGDVLLDPDTIALSQEIAEEDEIFDVVTVHDDQGAWIADCPNMITARMILHALQMMEQAPSVNRILPGETRTL